MSKSSKKCHEEKLTKDIHNELEAYFSQIKISEADYVPVANSGADAAYIDLAIPKEMLDNYKKLKGIRKKYPDGLAFLNETGLLDYLRKTEGMKTHGHTFYLNDVLDYLCGDVYAEFSDILRKDVVGFRIQEKFV